MKIVLFIFMLAFSTLTMANCPVDPSDATEIQNTISNSETCYEAVYAAENCAWGSSIDVGFVNAAIKICDSERGPLSAVDQAAYDDLVEKCYKKYENEQGTMYLSAAAFCALKVADVYSSVFSSIED